ncbi:hypothetical protein Ccrd_004376 [Cynara cardunculus var. scolymus]|uniref:Uncharacterized protein n=1 Tax=Cynara cardunculus var. scolymus TaxID=59895 RepID=A0A103XML9_CYNCS|nr:hypothetical protein Ccrd_004376 [Cynara cardunculus var. scolymus]
MDDTNTDQEVFERLLKVSFSKIIPSLRFKLLKKIKNSSTLREIPVVTMSSENILTHIVRFFNSLSKFNRSSRYQQFFQLQPFPHPWSVFPDALLRNQTEVMYVAAWSTAGRND